MEYPLISLITIVNNEQKYNEFKANLATQVEVNFELLKINNQNNAFTSARLAYNSAAEKAHGQLLVFCHPDIRFLDPHALHDIITYLIQLGEKVGVMGIAGTPFKLTNKNRIILTTIVHGDQQNIVGKKVTTPTEVQTLDECFFALTKKFWENHPFSSAQGWHLYAVEACLVANSFGYKNFVVPAHVWHTSDGKSEDYHYYLQLKQLIKKYRDVWPRINTTVKMWPTRGIKSKAYVNYWLLNRWVKQLLHISIK